MEKTILQNGTRVISYAPDNECTNELGTITSSYEYNGKVYYDIHLDNHEEGCEDLDMNEEGIHFDVIPEKFINLTPHDIKLNDGTVYPATSKYVVAKHIKVTTKTEVVVKTAKSSVVKTAEDAIRSASKFGLKAEVQRELDNGATPLDALREWDIIQSIRVLSKTLNCSLFINRGQRCK